MPSLSYAEGFTPLVESEKKLQTIRALRKRLFKEGDVLCHFTKMRHPGCRRLGYSIAESVEDIDIFAPIDHKAGKVFLGSDGQRPLLRTEINSLAKADGFEEVESFFGWFVVPPAVLKAAKGCNLDFHFFGQLIRWPTTWTKPTCPKCGDLFSDRKDRTLWCSSCNSYTEIGAQS